MRQLRLLTRVCPCTQLKDFGAAEDAFRIVAANGPENHPDVAQALNYLGLIMHHQGDHATAIEFLQRAVNAAPGHAQHWHDLGAVLMELTKPCDARDAYDGCLRADPAHLQCKNAAPIAAKKCALLEAGQRRSQLEANQR